MVWRVAFDSRVFSTSIGMAAWITLTVTTHYINMPEPGAIHVDLEQQG